MRLGTCIALELAVAAGAIGGLWFGVGQATELAGTYLTGSEAIAATAVPNAARPERLPRSYLHVPQRPIENVFGAPDGELLAPLGASKVTKIKLNHGGTSLSLRVDFASGARAAFKPEQIHPQSDPRREIAAFRIDRLLGIGHVPPATTTAIPVSELLDAAEPSHRTYIATRFQDEGIIRGGVLRGELSWWIPEIKLAKLGGHRIDEREGKELWTSYLRVGARIPDEARGMVEQIAAVVLFDVLIDNPDRWSGSNTEMSPDGKTLFFMDNSMSFSIFGFGHETNLGALRRIQVFPRRLVARIRALTEDQIIDALRCSNDHGLCPLLNPTEIHAIIVRRNNLLRYIDDLIAELGEDAVLALP
ncbi:MAG: hypothetical protein H0T46_04350 [Deltaproteobacteria bacterium]|nr:hypothetical protein [Deltaproteobacteria bacterium]